MRKVFVLFFVVILIISGCGKKDTGVKLEEGTPVYQLAEELSEKLEFLDPEKNNVLVATKNYDVTVGEALGTIQTGSGKNIGKIKAMPPERLKNYVMQFAERLAEQNILLNASKKANIVLTDAKVDSILNLQYSRAGGEEKYIEMLKKNGIGIDFVKDDIRKNLTINEYLETTLSNELEITEEKLQEIYQQDKTASVRHILLMTQGKTDSAKQEIRKKMEDILVKAEGGADFAELAKEYSEDKGSSKKGGLYEDFPRRQMVKPFNDAAFSVPVGEISDIVETRYGFHILKIIDRKKETKPFEEVRSQIEQGFLKKARPEAIQNHIKKLKEDTGYEVLEY